MSQGASAVFPGWHLSAEIEPQDCHHGFGGGRSTGRGVKNKMDTVFA